MIIQKVNIFNYKKFKSFSIIFTSGLNILVGDNEAGKSTILEAIHLALSGVINGKYIKNEISQHLFNYEISSQYLSEIKSGRNPVPPEITIEIFFDECPISDFKGSGNSLKEKVCGIVFKIEFDNDYKQSYNELLKDRESITSIPIEYYKITLKDFSRNAITTRTIPIKSALIDSTSNRYQNGSDVYLSRIIRDDLEENEKVKLTQAYRQMRDAFMENPTIENINERISKKSGLTSKKVNISAELPAKNAWEAILMTYLDGIPFHQVGKGEQCIIKTNLALRHRKANEASILLVEEPENHLSHTKLHELIKNISEHCCEAQKQVIISTHSSFVANKLGLENLILINAESTVRLNSLTPETFNFFKKLPGYNTLRLILCRKAVLVEGPSDELIFQRAYLDSQNCLPIENGVDVISVGLTAERFLEISDKINAYVAVVTDNDGDYEKKVKQKYATYENNEYIAIFASENDQLNTLEPQFARVNDLEALRKTFGIKAEEYDSMEKIIKYMVGNKTKWALDIFESERKHEYPDYINSAVTWCVNE